MRMQKTIIIMLLAFMLIAIFTIVSGASFLDMQLLGGLPFGNILAALGLLTMSGAAFILTTKKTKTRRLAFTALFAAIVWLPMSIFLAGNLLLTYSGTAGDIWIVLTISTALVCIVSLVFALLTLCVRNRGHSDTQNKT